MHDNQTISRSPSGMVSLLALILMATVTATAVGAAAIIINELRQTESLEQSFAAVYAAESGLEDGLYVVKASRSAQATLDNTIDIINLAPPLRSGLANLSSWKQFASLENQFVVTRLPVDTTAHLDIYNVDAIGGGGMARLEATWGVNCDKFMEMEITALTWDPANPFTGSSQQVFKQTFACNQVSDLVCDPIVLTGVAGHGFLATDPYRMSFRVLIPDRNITPEQAALCYGENLQATVYDAAVGGSRIELPNRVVVRSTGKFARSQQSLTASVPWRAPISGLFGFVVFSDEDLIK
ncbi:MAG: hypothetical protein HY340_00380 [Candidatus Kerfeldbacteria bacterium]|nr:hypothetical protein [Candidatus Kerfeldbacteria bacterium]